MERLEVLEFNHKEINELIFEKIIKSGLVEYVDACLVDSFNKHFVRWDLYIKNSIMIEVSIQYNWEALENPRTKEEILETRQYYRKIHHELKIKEDKINEQLKNKEI